MSKNITIQEGGVAKQLTVDKLRLKTINSGTEEYLPDDSVSLVKIQVKQNGTYKASDFGAYGISEVNVACTKNGGAATAQADAKVLDTASDVSIAVGGKSRLFSCKFLSTILTAGGFCRWVSEKLVNLGTKSANVDNRVYKAADDGYYGYSQFTLSGVSITTGTDADGNTVVTHTDGSGTVSVRVPDSIVIVSLPSKTVYTDGEQIDFSGMVVKAYLANGDVWTDDNHPDGIIPSAELTLPVTTADASQTPQDEYSDGAGVTARLITYTQYVDTAYNEPDKIRYLSEALGSYNDYPAMLGASQDGFMATFLATRYNGYLYVKGINGNEALNGYYYQQSPPRRSYHYGVFIGTAYTTKTPSGNFELRSVQNVYDWATGIPESTVDPTGAGTMEPVSGVQSIPVQWTRPGDYSTLETSFGITVI